MSESFVAYIEIVLEFRKHGGTVHNIFIYKTLNNDCENSRIVGVAWTSLQKLSYVATCFYQS